MDIIKCLRNAVSGKTATLLINSTEIQVMQDRKKLCYELPKAFREYNYLKHTEETAGWLQALLREEHVRLRRCRVVLDSGQAFMQAVKLPDMTEEEQKNWLHWEGGQYMPFAPENCNAALVRWNTGESSAAEPVFVQETEPQKQIGFLLVAVTEERIKALLEITGFLKAKLEEVTVLDSGQRVLPLNLLPAVARKELVLGWIYQGGTVCCLFLSLVLAVCGGVDWKRQELEWQKIRQQLIPLLSVKEEFTKTRETEYHIKRYQKELQLAEAREQKLFPLLQSLSESIPGACWLEELREEETCFRQPNARGSNSSGGSAPQAQLRDNALLKRKLFCLELRGCAESVASMLQFAQKLDSSGIFSDVRVTESGETQRHVTFTIRAAVSPGPKEKLP